MQHKALVQTNDMNLLLDIFLPGVETIPRLRREERGRPRP
jgi:hypothetical protein